MYRIRLDRFVALMCLLLMPLILRWLGANLHIGSFSNIPILGSACHNPEYKALILLGILLIGLVLIIKVILD